MSRDNPYLPDDFDSNIKHHLPSDHPMNEQSILTPLESFAYPVLLWFFDNDRARGSGRSYLMARVCLELAMRGKIVHLNDYHLLPTQGSNVRSQRNFLDNIAKLMNGPFKKYLFEINIQNMTLRYNGRRPN